jgi:hypothetical protein
MEKIIIVIGDKTIFNNCILSNLLCEAVQNDELCVCCTHNHSNKLKIV